MWVIFVCKDLISAVLLEYYRKKGTNKENYCNEWWVLEGIRGLQDNFKAVISNDFMISEQVKYGLNENDCSLSQKSKNWRNCHWIQTNLCEKERFVETRDLIGRCSLAAPPPYRRCSLPCTITNGGVAKAGRQ